MKNLKLRKANLNDFATIKKLQKEMLNEEKKYMSHLQKSGKTLRSYPDPELRKILKSPNSLFILAEYNGEVVGTGFARIEKVHGEWCKFKKRGYMGHLFVKKNFRREGIAQAIFDERIRWLKSRGIRFVVQRMFYENNPAERFLKKQGYKPYILEMHMIK